MSTNERRLAAQRRNIRSPLLPLVRRQAITWMDDALETLMAKVDDLGMRKTTMTIYISDHQADIIGKGTCYYAANVPFIVHW